MNRGALAKQYFLSGHNCAQAVLLAFSDLTGLDKPTSMKLASSFGGGMGRLREVCGAVSGMFLTLGILYGDGDVPTQENKAAHYRRVQELAAQFRNENGSIVCRELLSKVETTTGSAPEARTQEYYTKRPCAELCACAADILSQLIENNPPMN